MPFFLAGRAMLGRDGAEFSRIVLHRALRSMFAGRGTGGEPRNEMVTCDTGAGLGSRAGQQFLGIVSGQWVRGERWQSRRKQCLHRSAVTVIYGFILL